MKQETLSPLATELLSRADSIFAKIAEAAGKAGDFAAEQLPDIAYQFIAFNRAYYTFLIVICVLLICLAVYLMRKWWDFTEGAIIIPSFLTVGLAFVICVNTVKQFFMVWFAPKIFIITEIVNLVK